MTPGELHIIKEALEACQFEFTTLIPRLTQPYRQNAQSCKGMATEALAIINREVEEKKP